MIFFGLKDFRICSQLGSVSHSQVVRKWMDWWFGTKVIRRPSLKKFLLIHNNRLPLGAGMRPIWGGLGRSPFFVLVGEFWICLMVEASWKILQRSCTNWRICRRMPTSKGVSSQRLCCDGTPCVVFREMPGPLLIWIYRILTYDFYAELFSR